MNKGSITDRRAVVIAGAVLLVVLGLPWIGTAWASASLFGFPMPGFLLFLLGPVLLIVIAGLGPQAAVVDDAEDIR